MTPQVLAILQTSYSGRAQARAFSMFGPSLGIGAVFGQLIGGLLIKADVLGLDWRTCEPTSPPRKAGAAHKSGPGRR